MTNATERQVTLNQVELAEIVERLQATTTALYGIHQAIEASTHAIMTDEQLRGILKPLTAYMVRVIEHDLDNTVNYLAELVGGAEYEPT